MESTGATKCDPPVSPSEKVLELALLSEATAEEKVEQLLGPTRSYILYIGNLNPKYSQEVICNLLKDILTVAGISLQRHNIEVVRKHTQAHAFVHVATEECLEHILKQLLLASESEQPLVKELVKKGKNLVVGQGKKSGFGASSSRETNSIGSILESHRGRTKPPSKETQTNSTSWFAQYTRSRRWTDGSAAFLGGTRSDSAIVQNEIVGKERLFYGAFMGNETRNTEFKRGGGDYLTVTLKHHVRKYMCAFLNSEGGSLLVGVEDSGLVLGVPCDHKDEDRVRLLIDSILKGFKPPVFPAAYTLSFIPVIKAEDTGIFLKVIRLTVLPPTQHGEPFLYETDQGEVYIRRDGSIQGPLSGSAIQEWCRQIKELDKSQKVSRETSTTLELLDKGEFRHLLASPRFFVCSVVRGKQGLALFQASTHCFYWQLWGGDDGSEKWTEEIKKLEEKMENLLKEEMPRRRARQNTSPRCCACM